MVGGTHEIRYRLATRRPPPPHTASTMHAIAEKGLFMYSTSELSSSASRIVNLINKLIWRIRGRVCAQPAGFESRFGCSRSRRNRFKTRQLYLPAKRGKFSEACSGAFCERSQLSDGKERSEIPPRPSPPSQSIMISSPSLLWESS